MTRDFTRPNWDKSPLERQNDLLSAQLMQAERHHKDRKKQSYENRIYQLRLALAQASDSYQREQIQMLLDELTADYEAYLEQLRKERRVFWIITLLGAVIVLPFVAFATFDMIASNKQAREELRADRFSKMDSSAISSLQETQESLTGSSSSVGIASLQAEKVDANLSKSTSADFQEFTVEVTGSDLNIRQQPSTSAEVVGTISTGVYTVVEKQFFDGHVWGRLKSGEGWISLTAIGRATLGAEAPPNGIGWASQPDSETAVDQKNLTTKQVEDWVRAAFMRMDDFSQMYDPTRLEITVNMASDGLVYADLTYLHDEPWHYRINGKGQLERQSDGWQLEAETYFDSW